MIILHMLFINCRGAHAKVYVFNILKEATILNRLCKGIINQKQFVVCDVFSKTVYIRNISFNISKVSLLKMKYAPKIIFGLMKI